MKILLLNDSITDPNWGDRAAAISLKALIRGVGAEIAHSIPEDDLITSSFSERFLYLEEEPRPSRLRELVRLVVPTPILEVRRRMLRDADPLAANHYIPRRWEDFAEAATTVVRDKPLTWGNVIEAIEDSDVAVIHGDGAMWGKGIIPRSDLFLAYLIKTHFKKPVVIVNHSVDLGAPELREMAEHVYPLFDDVVYRDPLSAERYKHLCEGRFAADTAFWFEPAPKDSWLPIARRPTYFDVWPDIAGFDPSAPYLCVGGSSLLATAWNPVGIAKDFRALLEHLQTVYKGQIVLTVSGLQELGVFRPLAREMGLSVLAPTMPVQQVVDILGHSNAYVGGRWHTAIFALRGGAPVVPFAAKQSKMEGLMVAASLSTATFDPFGLAESGQAIGTALLDLLEQGHELRGRLRAWADQMAVNAWDNVTYLRNALP